MTDLSALESLYYSVLEHPPESRAAFLDEACQGKPELRACVERLLAAHPKVGGFLEPPAPAATNVFVRKSTGETTGSYTAAAENISMVIGGKYKLIELLGEGGMGSVYVAQQTEPVKRLVAIKVIKEGMDSKHVLARFEAERQALAMMDHPNIARVLDAGSTDQERPYFVMELVKGIPITTFCDERKLSPRQRLELFVLVCQAVQHAHQKGIIHRDLKPTNVLVALYDGKPVPKVIDFGIAKATGQPLTDRTLVTGFGAVVGTPEYMSPEQAELNQLDIDTRSDVYALGVLLYELLTGTTPVNRSQLGKAALLEVLRIVREEEPPRPSTRLSTSDALPGIAASRNIEPNLLTRLLRRELDWVVMKALEKDRNRRYETANGFAADIQRYLAGEPVLAVPPSAGYRFGKFVRRHKARVLAVTALFLTLVAGIVSTTWGLVLANQAERNEAGQRREAERLQREAVAERKKIELQAASTAIDLDLEYCRRNDTRTGILRLARRLKTLPNEATELRQFVILSLFAWAQEEAPLVPAWSPAMQAYGVSPKGRTLYISQFNGPAELRDLYTGRIVAVAADNASTVRNFEFTSDGRSAVGNTGGFVTVWDLATGQPRTVIHPAPGFIVGVFVDSSASRVVTVTDQTKPDNRLNREVLVQLWDGATGQCVATLDHPGGEIGGRDLIGSPVNFCRFSPDGRSLLTCGRKVAFVWSTATGQLLHSLGDHSSNVVAVAYSPSGTRAVTCDGQRVYWWRTADWQPDGLPHDLPSARDRTWRFSHVQFLHEDILKAVFADTVRDTSTEITQENLFVHGEPGSQFLDAIHSDGEFVITPDDRVYALRPFRRLELPGAQKFPDAFRRDAISGRFLVLKPTAYSARLIDLATDRQIGRDGAYQSFDSHPTNGYSFVGLTRTSPIVLPDPNAPFDNDLLELWAQVLVRGQLDTRSGFVATYDEPTWEKKRQELVRRAQPVGQFPFPGAFAADRLFWLRKEIEGANDKQELLLDRLITAEPTAAHYRLRAQFHEHSTKRFDLAIRDALAANRIEAEAAGRREQNALWSFSPFGNGPAEKIIFQPNLPREHYELALQWYDASDNPNAKFRERGIALFRLGRYQDALRALGQPERTIVAGLGAAVGTPLALLRLNSPLFDGDEIRWMTIGLCQLQLGRRGEALTSLARARAVDEVPYIPPRWQRHAGGHQVFLREGELVILAKE